MNHASALTAHNLHLVVGTYTDHLPHVNGRAEGILGLTFNDSSGQFGPVTTLNAAHNPSYLALSSNGTRLYALDETNNGPHGQGWISAYARDPSSGSTTLLSTVPSGGSGPTHLTLSSSERFLLIAHYQSGSVTAFALDDLGDLGAMTGAVSHTGSGPRQDRQGGPHAHMVHSIPSRGTRKTDDDVLAVDLGTDTVFVHRLDPDGQLDLRTEGRIRATPGAGPRHLAMHPDQRHIFIVTELDSTVMTVYRDAVGKLHPIEVAPTSAGLQFSQPSAVSVTPSGMYVLVANRGVDTLALLRFDPGSGRLELLDNVHCGGRHPRDVTLTPNGHVIVAALDDDILVAHHLDEQAATLTVTDKVHATSPACVLAIPRQPSTHGGLQRRAKRHSGSVVSTVSIRTGRANAVSI